jgi:pimeloyl-ACP methyl ester carboxylesterase
MAKARLPITFSVLFFTETIPKATAEWVLSENLKFPRQHAARLLLDLYAQDWRDVICRITLPTLVLAGESSIFSPLSQRWMADQIPNAQYEYFLTSEGGSHFMWLENPTKFNEIVRKFINHCSTS